MINHTSVVSGDLPDYFLGKHEWARPVRPVHAPAKGQRAVLNQVSEDAPASFQLRHVQASSASVRKSVFNRSQSPLRDSRLLQELRGAQYHDYSKFSYEDFDNRQTVDYSSLPMALGADILKGNSAGARAKLPFYVAYAEAVKAGKFSMKQGMFSHKARQKVVGRADGALLRSLRTVASARGRLRQSVESAKPARDESAESPEIAHHPDRSYYAVYLSRMSLPNSKAVRSLLTASCSRKRPSKCTTSHTDLSTSKDIEAFEQLRKTESQNLHPVTKKSLGKVLL